MDSYLSDEEHAQKIKGWWKKYGSSVIIGVLVFLVGSFGWRYWQSYTTKKAEQASVVYEEMVAADVAKQTDNFKLFADHLLKDYRHTSYASLAGLMLAQKANNLLEAQQHLQWVIDHASSRSLRQIARLREARILLARKQPEQALKLLQRVDDKTFQSKIEEVKGDAYLAMGDKAKALQAYQTALKTIPKNNDHSLLALKINHLQ